MVGGFVGLEMMKKCLPKLAEFSLNSSSFGLFVCSHDWWLIASFTNARI